MHVWQFIRGDTPDAQRHSQQTALLGVDAAMQRLRRRPSFTDVACVRGVAQRDVSRISILGTAHFRPKFNQLHFSLEHWASEFGFERC